MNQIVHIFKKDVRRFSWDIGLSLSLTALYAWCQPMAWRPFELLTGEGARYVGASLLGPLLVLAWMVMLTRLIHQESPVGDKQFWVTRPYRWPDLLAAKLLFVLAFITIPLLIAQLLLLAAAGFGASHHLSVLFQIHLVLTVFLLLVAALAVVTGAAQRTRTAFLVLIFLIASVLTGSSIVPYRYSSIWDWPGRVLLIVIPALVIVRQYALRKTTQAQWLLFGGVSLFLIIRAIPPAATMNEAQYPMLSAGSESYFEINLNPPAQPGNPDDALPGIVTPAADSFVEVVLHLSGTGVAEGRVVQTEAIRVTLQAPDGTQWSSRWQPWQAWFGILEHEASSEPEPRPTADIRLFVDKSFVERVRHVPITMQVTAAAGLFRDQGGISITPAQDEFTVPGLGTCAVEQAYVYAYMVFCRTAQDPPPMLVTARMFRSCPPSQSDLAGPPVRITAQTPDAPGGNEFRLSPVKTFSPLVEHRSIETRYRKICPGSPLTFRLPELMRRFRVEKEFKNVRLVDYIVHER